MADAIITSVINIPSDQIVTTPATAKTLTSGKLVKAGTANTLVDVTPQTELTDELTTITFTAPATPDYALQDLVDSSAGATFGFATKDEGNTVLSVIANLQTRVNELETKLVALGLLADAD